MNLKLFKKNLKFFKRKKKEIYKLLSNSIDSKPIIKEYSHFINIQTSEGIYIENLHALKKDLISNLSLSIFLPEFKEDPNLEDYLHYRITESMDKLIEENKDSAYYKKVFLEEKYVPLLFLNGLGTGNIINIIKEYGIDFKYLIIYESDISKFTASLYYVDWESLYDNHNVYIVAGDNENKIKEGFELIFSEINPVYLSFVLFVSIYVNNQKHLNIEDIYKKVVHVSTKGWGFYDDEKVGLKNAFDNINKKIPYLYKPSIPIKNSNVFIIGSGPSLEKDITYIRRNQNKAIIISCGTALHKLYKENILPDFHIELERENIRRDILLELPEDFLKKVVLITADVVPPSITSMFRNSFLFLRTNSTHQFLLNPSLIPPAITPTVVNTGVSLAVIFGMQNIYLFGTDMGYKNINKKHVEGTIFDKKKYKYIEQHTTSYIKVEGNFEKYVYTDDILFWAKSNLEKLINAFPDRNFINFSDGALIKGTKKPDNTNVLKENYVNKEFLKSNIYSLFSTNYNDFMKPDFNNYYVSCIEVMEEIKKIITKSELSNRVDYLYLIDEVINIIKKYKNNEVVNTLLTGSVQSILSFLYKAVLLVPEEKNLFIIK
ncbi:6-hydroxymethylpterin diphosphokinase MptE-like protein, partial [Hydrogenivirga sp. 128-5-R1-1]|uniref:motility associated factor glycosyltransferase family protein n=1 Tax=Hydrogenivirga sp. 128-5-R1-1 TaxID=392423 RepID=UPI00015F2AB5